MTDKYTAALDYARKLGREHGTNAAAWYTQDAFGGRVTRGADESARRILDGIAEGDPAILDTFPVADLSGEWADSLTGPQLAYDAITSASVIHGKARALDQWTDDICTAYESAFAEAASDEIERAARESLPEDDEPTDTAAIAAMRQDDGTLPAYAWPGAYQLVYYTRDGLTVCPKCANDPDTSDPVIAGEVYWEGPDMVCDDKGESIPSAYGDPDAQD